MKETEDLLTEELEVTGKLKSYLVESAKWAKFLSVTGLVVCAGMLVMAFYAGFFISRIMAERYGFSIGPALSAVYIFIAVLWFFPCLFLYKFSVRLKSALQNNIQENIETAFLNLRSTFKFLGIVIIIIFSLWLASFLLLFVKSINH